MPGLALPDALETDPDHVEGRSDDLLKDDMEDVVEDPVLRQRFRFSRTTDRASPAP